MREASVLRRSHSVPVIFKYDKADWAGRTVVIVDRWFPSSRTCSACGAIKADLSLRDRTWTCAACGASHDRDQNAASNIEREGLRLLAEGSGSPGDTRRRRGIHARGEAKAGRRNTPRRDASSTNRELSYRCAPRGTPVKAAHDVPT